MAGLEAGGGAILPRCARQCGGCTGRMYHCIERCGQQPFENALSGHLTWFAIQSSTMKNYRTTKAAGANSSCRPKCGPQLPGSEEISPDIETTRQPEAEPINVLQRLDGPSNEVIIDKIYAAAQATLVNKS